MQKQEHPFIVYTYTKPYQILAVHLPDILLVMPRYPDWPLGLRPPLLDCKNILIASSLLSDISLSKSSAYVFISKFKSASGLPIAIATWSHALAASSFCTLRVTVCNINMFVIIGVG